MSPRQRKEKSFPGKETVPCKVGGGSTGEGGRRGPLDWTKIGPVGLRDVLKGFKRGR